MNKILEGFVKLTAELKEEAGLSDEASIELLQRIRDGTKTPEDEETFEKISGS